MQLVLPSWCLVCYSTLEHLCRVETQQKCWKHHYGGVEAAKVTHQGEDCVLGAHIVVAGVSQDDYQRGLG